MKHPFVYVLVFLLCVKDLSAQKTDSLLRLLPNSKDTQRVQVLYNLCYEYAYNEPATGKRYGTEALQLAKKINYTLGTAKSLNRLGIIYDVTGHYDSAIYYYSEAGIYYDKAHNRKGKAAAINNAGMIYATKGNYNLALEKHFEALKIFESIGDSSSVASGLNNIGNVYADLENFPMAFQYYHKASVINHALNNREALGSNYTNIAASLRESGKLDSALLYAEKSVVIQTLTDNQYGLGIVYSLIGNLYSQKKDSKKALDYMFRSLKIRIALNDEAGRSSILYNIADEYRGIRNMALAEKYAIEAHQLALQLNSYRMLRKTAMMLFMIYTAEKKYDKAVQYVDIAMTARDSTMNEETNRNMAELQTKYETEKQALELEKKNLALNNASLEIEQKRSTITLLVIGCILVIVLGLGIYHFNRLKQQRLLDAQLLSQQELRTKAIIETEEKERIRIARELHDGIGQQLSAARLSLSSFEYIVPAENKQSFRDLTELMDDAIKEVRSISHNMIPNSLLRAGLVSAVRDFVNKLSGSGVLKIDLEVVGINERLDNAIETSLYRVIQECVSNILKHAEASHVTIQLIQHDNHLNLMIEDNGKGFNTAGINNFEGIGLKNIMSRVLYLNGTIDFDSAPGRGTTVSADIPLGSPGEKSI